MVSILRELRKNGIKPLNLNDCFINDANFALFDSHIPQARLAKSEATIAEMSEKAPKLRWILQPTRWGRW